MKESPLELADTSKDLCRDLRGKRYPTPQNTLFSGEAFDTVCENLQDRNETRIISDITRLLVPTQRLSLH